MEYDITLLHEPYYVRPDAIYLITLHEQALLRQFCRRILSLISEEMMLKVNPTWYDAWQAQLGEVKQITMDFTGGFCYLKFVHDEVKASQRPFPGLPTKGYSNDSNHQIFHFSYKGELFCGTLISFLDGYLDTMELYNFGMDRETFIPLDMADIEPLYDMEDT